MNPERPRFDAYVYCHLSGTLMAAPHAGAALYLQGHPLAAADEVEAAIVSSATTGLEGRRRLAS